MRLFRALVHLVLALAVLAAAPAQSRAAGAMAAPLPQEHAHHAVAAGHGEHRALTGGHPVAVADAAHDHGPGHDERPAHGREACQTACCFAPVQQPLRALDATAVQFSSTVRYAEFSRPLSGRVCAPDPGVPKRAA